MQRVIGIDYGTSTTYMNVKRYNGGQPVEDKFSYMPVVFNYGESSGFVSSIARENADGTFDFGEKAAEPLEGATVYTEIKMRLESPDESKRTEARRITREFFKFLYATYTQQASSFGSPDDTEETVISYPVKWRKETAEFMLDAARSAGFRNVRGMDEATAAVSTVFCQSSDGKSLIYADKPGYLMLIDMGAGTTDLVICKYAARTGGGIDVELVTNWPQSADEPTFGGREIDAVLEKYVEEYLAKSLNPALAPQAHIIAAAPGQAKMWKERNVSASLAANKPVNTCAYIGTYRTMGMLTGDFPSFDRKGFEETAAQGLRDYVRLLEGCLAEAAKKDEAFADAGVDLVILTGGHSAWYFAREIIDGTMEGWLDHPALTAVRENKYRVVSLPNPQTTVSLGLIYSKLSFKLEKRVEPNVTYHYARPRQKEVIRQSATQIHKIEENESFDDAFNRFKKQTKEAQHQQEVPIKPAQTGGRVYRWDDRLLPIIEEFIRQEPALRKRNELYQRMFVVANLKRSFRLPADDIVYYATPFGVFESTRIKGETGYIFAASGLWHRDKVWRTIKETHYTWEMFLNSEIQLEYGSKQIFSENLIYRALTLEIHNPDSLNNPGGEMSRLQKLLREKSVALEEGRPI